MSVSLLTESLFETDASSVATSLFAGEGTQGEAGTDDTAGEGTLGEGAFGDTILGDVCVEAILYNGLSGIDGLRAS